MWRGGGSGEILSRRNGRVIYNISYGINVRLGVIASQSIYQWIGADRQSPREHRSPVDLKYLRPFLSRFLLALRSLTKTDETAAAKPLNWFNSPITSRRAPLFLTDPLCPRVSRSHVRAGSYRRATIIAI